MLAARDDLATISKIAERRGFTLVGYLNELLELAIKVDSMGVSLKEAVDSYELARQVKESVSPSLESLLYDTAAIAYEKANDQTLKAWFDAGIWIAQRIFSTRREGPSCNL